MENFGLDALKAKFHLLNVGAGLMLLLAVAGGGYWYHYNSVQKEQAATTILADCLSQYEQAAQGKAQWADVVTMAHAGYDKFSNTKVAPYILSVEVDGLLAQDKKQEALDRLDLMVSSMNSSSPLYDLYKLKQALIKLDMPDLKDAALKDLQKLAVNQKSNFADAAQYYLGLYYQTSGDQQKALEVWKPLVAVNDTVTDSMARSPWATMAESKINGLA
jgi:hypothetical protein